MRETVRGFSCVNGKYSVNARTLGNFQKDTIREEFVGPHLCPWWFAYTFDNPIRSLFHKPERIFAEYVRKGMTVADIGCGLGYFSIGLAGIVKKEGKVIAADIQPKMLEKLCKRAVKAGLQDIVQAHQTKENDIGIHETIDFALAFWMLHEVVGVKNFLRQIYSILKPEGLLLVTEPAFHVTGSVFESEMDIAVSAGFRIEDRPEIKFSRSAVLKKVM